MVKKIISDIRELTCSKCGKVWTPRNKNPVKCPNPKCQAQMKKWKPQIRILRTEITKKILTL